MPTFSAPCRISGGSRSSGFIDHSRRQSPRMKGMTVSSTKSRQLCRINRCTSERSVDIEASSIRYARHKAEHDEEASPQLRRFAAGQKVAHAIERLQDTFG